MPAFSEFSVEALRRAERESSEAYEAYRSRGLKLDMSRGKPASSQLDLCNGALCGPTDFYTEKGVDARNYGILDGLSEMRRFFGELLSLDPENIIVGGNSSLNLMYDLMTQLMLFGTAGETPWGKLGKVKFLAPCPGYDRHFAITEKLGIEMINIEMTPAGPDMDRVEELVASDPAIKGIWCVPLYSNPQGICYSDETVARLGAMKCAARDFRIFWDNAYGVHHIDGETKLADIFSACDAGGNPDRAYYFFSTSKITFPGAGVSLVASSAANKKEILARLSVETIGYDKLNQLRTLRFLPTPEALRLHMKKLAGEIKPKFDLVLNVLDKEFSGTGLLSWSVPRGGYFIAVDTLDGCAKATVELAAAAGVKLTGPGAAFPYHRDPRDRNIRLAPTYPTLAELDEAMRLFAIAAKLAGVRKLLSVKSAE
ncbi:MAG: aminotransferase [Victivallaceae bacterium]|nr:aminotransferase [Victivallaceae bacterium]